MNREIPIIADAMVDREFGTGAVKITPAHDPNDFEVGRRHKLAEIDVMTDDGKMNAAAGAYAGMDRFEARKKIVEDLKALGLLEKITEHTNHSRQPARGIFQLDAKHPRLDAVAATLVGPPDSSVALRRLQGNHRGARGAHEVHKMRIGKAGTGSGRAGHVV